MKLLACALFIVAWTTSCQALIVPEDCNDARIEKSAEVALNLINEHRKEGYIFTLFRIADAHVQHVENASITYLTLDVLETQCPVISRKHWSSCGHRPFLSITDLGQCKAVVYINELSKRKLLYAYNCTVSPVPPKLYECKDCPVRITVLEDTDKHTEEANKILETYSLGSNESNYFKVEKVQKVISANLGFCIGRIVKETQSPDVVQVDSCEIYDIQTLSIFPHHHPHHFHHDSGESHHHCNVTGHECRYRPVDHHPRPCGRFPKCGHWHRCHHHHHRSNDTAYKREESQSLEDQDSFHHSSVGSVHHVPILNEHDVLQAPGANFLDHPFTHCGTCTAVIDINESQQFTSIEQNCKIKPAEDNRRSLAQECPGCHSLIAADSQELKKPLEDVVKLFNLKSSSDFYFKIVEITKISGKLASYKVDIMLVGHVYRIDFKTQRTNCSKTEVEKPDENNCTAVKGGTTELGESKNSEFEVTFYDDDDDTINEPQNF
ncbi:histidine-rich glycoprotein [Protobothrops mucrosquamatus]|uniref:histidine-rich glycoprotein n=1 Tax=Protobothrops mucrosquamatus TaxID=103944 RepID=UPI0010FB432F|nr:histidine-rich glycoprotein [Protobothrops mucrosquamatus]